MGKQNASHLCVRKCRRRVTKKILQLHKARTRCWIKPIMSVTSDASMESFGSEPSDRASIGTATSATEVKFSYHSDEICHEKGAAKTDSCNMETTCDEGKSSSVIRLVDISLLSNLVATLSCSFCGKNDLKIVENGRLGLASELSLKCFSCQTSLATVMTSRRNGNKLNSPFETTQRTMTAMINMGVGYAGLEKFTTVMGMKSLHHKTFNKIFQQSVSKAIDVVAIGDLENASQIVRKAYKELSPDSGDIINVSYDGSWLTRGHTSNFGVGVVIDIITGLVLDYQVMSKYCHICAVNSKQDKEWQDQHLSLCDKNFDGTSGGMEIAAAKLIWKRSVEKHGFRYTVLSDGDSKTYNELCKEEIYGSSFPIQKEECINRVSKRMGSALRKTVGEHHAKGITLGGKAG